MKINVVAYYDPFKFSGGGEMIVREVLQHASAHAVDIHLTTVRPYQNDFQDDADLDCVVDVFNFPNTLKSRGAWRGFETSLLEYILQRRRLIHFNNAYVDVCNMGYLPCSGNAETQCPYKSPWHIVRNLAAKDFSTTCFAQNQLIRRLFSESQLNIFLSPLHAATTKKILDIQPWPQQFILKPTMNTQLFQNRGLKRDIDYLFVGVIGEAKGLENMRAQFADKDIHFVGKKYPGAQLGFGTDHGPQPYEKVAEFMNRAKNFVFLPRWPEPQGRVVIEAALCGCNLITNENVGATSFPFNISDPKNFSGAVDEFWDTVKKI